VSGEPICVRGSLGSIVLHARRETRLVSMDNVSQLVPIDAQLQKSAGIEQLQQRASRRTRVSRAAPVRQNRKQTQEMRGGRWLGETLDGGWWLVRGFGASVAWAYGLIEPMNSATCCADNPRNGNLVGGVVLAAVGQTPYIEHMHLLQARQHQEEHGGACRTSSKATIHSARLITPRGRGWAYRMWPSVTYAKLRWKIMALCLRKKKFSTKNKRNGQLRVRYEVLGLSQTSLVTVLRSYTVCRRRRKREAVAL
jgi:hypothetical protein